MYRYASATARLLVTLEAKKAEIASFPYCPGVRAATQGLSAETESVRTDGDWQCGCNPSSEEWDHLAGVDAVLCRECVGVRFAPARQTVPVRYAGPLSARNSIVGEISRSRP